MYCAGEWTGPYFWYPCLKRPAFGALGIERDMVVVCEGYRGVVVYLELLLWKFTDASRDFLGTSVRTSTEQLRDRT